jgi:hypothetical protein
MEDARRSLGAARSWLPAEAGRTADGWQTYPAGCVRLWRAPDTGRTWCRGGDADARASQAPFVTGKSGVVALRAPVRTTRGWQPALTLG